MCFSINRCGVSVKLFFTVGAGHWFFGCADAWRGGLPGLPAALQNGKNP